MGEKMRNILDLIPPQLQVDWWEHDGSIYSCICLHCQGRVEVNNNGIVTNRECLNSVKSCLRAEVEKRIREFPKT